MRNSYNIIFQHIKIPHFYVGHILYGYHFNGIIISHYYITYFFLTASKSIAVWNFISEQWTSTRILKRRRDPWTIFLGRQTLAVKWWSRTASLESGQITATLRTSGRLVGGKSVQKPWLHLDGALDYGCTTFAISFRP